MPTYLTLPEYAKYKKLPRSTVYAMKERGDIKTVLRTKLIPRKVRVPCVRIDDTEECGVK